jgi:uncharacterized protein (TIGR02597 family)
MKNRLHFLVVFGIFGWGISCAMAVTAATPPAGYFRLEAGGGRDNRLSVPLVQRAVVIRHVAAAGASTLVLHNAQFVADAYAPTTAGSFQVQFVTGNLAGVSYKILGNTADELTLDTQGDDLGNHSLGAVVTGESGDLVRIRPYWTVAGVFGQTSGDVSLTPLAGAVPSIYLDGDALILPDNQTLGTGKTSGIVLGYVAGQGWRRRGEPVENAGAFELPPGVSFDLRRQNATPFQTVVVGYISQEPGVLRLPALAAGGETEVYAALFHPVALNPASAGLSAVVEGSTSALDPRDLLFVSTPNRAGFSIPFARRFRLTGSSWYEGDTVVSDPVMQPGTGLLIRLRGERPVRYWRQAKPN